ncbi:MAG: 50S ribosomal protein L19 [Candidatus Shikimatogenerans sp. Tduv]|uniref:Large ribosomal subunit protein bL19 n=1 Tax=Candidatus Shikimatogenerans sp. Tduv TaxID=3158567 RepID=A0AAU7QRJ7_9FLAO
MINFKKGDIITIYYNIIENNKIKKLFFKGIVIYIKGKKIKEKVLLRKFCDNIIIDRIFFLQQKNIINIIINNINKKRYKKKKIFFIKKKKYI